MLVTNKRIEELEVQVEHLQEILDNLRDDFEYLENFTTKTLCAHIDDRFKELEDYLNIERVKDNTYYRSKSKLLYQ